MATEETALAGVWVKHPKSGVVSYVVHPDTIARCRAEGFAFVPDPRLPVVTPPPDAAPATEPRASVAQHAALDDLTVIADTPADLTAALEAVAQTQGQAPGQDVRDVVTRNTAARTAFGIETNPQPTAVKPTVVRKAGQHGNRA